MVCSDIAARGLDIPEIGHIVMFDFPLNPIDYLHRAGRCGRAGRKGTVHNHLRWSISSFVCAVCNNAATPVFFESSTSC